QWSFGDSTFSLEKNPVHIYKKPGSYAVTEIITTDKNCNDTITNFVTINPEPFVIAYPKDTTIIYGTAALLNSAFGTTYSWWPSDALSDPNIADPIANPIIPTQYH